MMVPVFLYVVAVKLSRGGPSPLAPDWLAGVLPNLACAAVVPLAAFVSPRALRFRDFITFDALICAGLCGYEVAQLWMPRRTFDTNDLWASAAGAVFALLPGAVVFAATRRPTDPSGPD